MFHEDESFSPFHHKYRVMKGVYIYGGYSKKR